MVNRQKLIEDNTKLVYFVIHRNFPKYSGDEDLIQVGMVGLCRAANAWDESKGTFANFAVNCIYYEMCSEFKSRNKRKIHYSLDYLYSDSEDESVTLSDMLVGDSDVDWFDIDEIYSGLTEKEKIIVDMKRMGLNNSEIAKKLGVSRQCISTHLRVAKLRLEKKNDY